jgi:hypothetical protein
MKKEKSTVIGHLAAQMAAYELHKAKKTERLNEAIKICEDLMKAIYLKNMYCSPILKD